MSEDEWTDSDDVIKEVREVRRRLWEQFDNDPRKYVAHLQDFHDQLVRDGVIKTTLPCVENGKSAA